MVPTVKEIVSSIWERRFLMDNTQSFPLVKALCDPPDKFESSVYVPDKLLAFRPQLDGPPV